MSELGPNNYAPLWPAQLPNAQMYSPVIGDGNVFRKVTNVVGDNLPPLAQILDTLNAPLDFIDGDSTIYPARSGIFFEDGLYDVTFDATSITLPAVYAGPDPKMQGYLFRPNLVIIKKPGADTDQMIGSCATQSLASTTRFLTLTPRAGEFFKWTGLDSTTVQIELFQSVTMRSIFAHVRGYYGTGAAGEGSDGEYFSTFAL